MALSLQETLPAAHRPYTDKYFIRTRRILEAEELNPQVSLKVFTRGKGVVAGVDEAVRVFETYAPDLADHGGEVWVTQRETFTNGMPLLVVKGPAQTLVELETLYLGILSHHLSVENNCTPPTVAETEAAFQRLTRIYGDIPIVYFGARHFHWSMDKQIAGAALRGGAVQTSTDTGSSNIGEEGVGTMPHFLVLVMAWKHGKKHATLEAAKAFHKHVDPSVPRVTLVDTFNREATDALTVADYFDQYLDKPDWRHDIRIDTPGENLGEGANPREGTGVTPSLVAHVRGELIDHGYADNVNIFLSSGFGKPDKARTFMDAQEQFKEETGHELFTGVGVGDFLQRNWFTATADIFQIEGEPLAKTGREVGDIDYSTLQQVI